MKKSHTYTVPMSETFNLLEKRLLDANLSIDNISLKEALNNDINTAVVIGCGGSLVVANYLSKVLLKRNVFSITKNARDIMHDNYKYDSIFSFSYSGKTHGIKLALDKFKGDKKYLITCNDIIDDKDEIKKISLGYSGMEKEKSFISLSSTLIPMGELLKISDNISKEDFNNFLKNILYEIKEWSNNQNFDLDKIDVFEIMTGSDTNTVSLFLESTLIESGLGIPIIHDKYDYCHGRSTTAYKNRNKHHLIYLINEKTEIDDFLLSTIKDNYNDVTVIDTNIDTTSLKKEYYLTLKAMFLCKRLAYLKKIDISQVEYDTNIVSKVYKYKGEM